MLDKTRIMQQTVEQNLSREELQKLRNNRTGLAIFQVAWMLVFVALVFVNLQLRANAPTWPPPGVAKYDPLIPTLMTLALVVSSVFGHRGVSAIKQDDPGAFRSNWKVTLSLGVVFALVMGFLWMSVPESGQYSMLFRVMTGFHFVHALVIGLFLWNIYRSAPVYGSRNFWMPEAGRGLWDFVTVAWVLFYVVLYLI